LASLGAGGGGGGGGRWDNRASGFLELAIAVSRCDCDFGLGELELIILRGFREAAVEMASRVLWTEAARVSVGQAVAVAVAADGRAAEDSPQSAFPSCCAPSLCNHQAFFSETNSIN
jgi:hypothetical protein